jgi:hypothetical protein
MGASQTRQTMLRNMNQHAVSIGLVARLNAGRAALIIAVAAVAATG